MPLVSHRDLEEIRRATLEWLRKQIPSAEKIELPLPLRPGAGGSSETLFLNPKIQERGMERQEQWVLRIEATDFQIYQHPSVERQYRVMQLLPQFGAAPVPKVLWYEPDPRTLGAPFFVMERVAGELPADQYHARGLLAEATPAAREAMWLSAVEALTRIHRVDVGPFLFLARPNKGNTGLDQEIAVWDEYARWSGSPLRPIQARARQWLDNHAPSQRPTGLAWGDARLGNMVFRNNACVAVIDWETVSLGGAETDLGWWLYFDWMVSEGSGVPRLKGIGGREETLKTWEQFAGRKAQAMEWHEVFATWRYSLISDRARHLMRTMDPEHAPAANARSLPAERLAMLIGN